MNQPIQAKRPHVGFVADDREPRDLTGRTLRTVAVLVGACVLFVGGLSTTAVVIANKAVGAPTGADRAAEERSAAESTADTNGTNGTKSAAPKKPASTTPHAPGVVGHQSI